MNFLLFIFFICTVIFSQTREVTQNGTLIGTENVRIMRHYLQDTNALVMITNDTNIVLQIDITILYKDARLRNPVTIFKSLMPQSTTRVTLNNFAYRLIEADSGFNPRRLPYLGQTIQGVCIDERYKDKLIVWVEEGDLYAHYIFKSS